MNFKVGDKVRIKSIDWYNENKDKYDSIYAGNGFAFWKNMARFCGEIMKITSVKIDPEDSNKGYYFMENSEEFWTDEMIECLVEEEPQLKFKVGDSVRIKSIDWWNDNNDNNINESVRCVKCKDWKFIADMKKYCGKILTIEEVHKEFKRYKMSEDKKLYSWTDEMIEGLVDKCLVEEESQLKYKVGDKVRIRNINWYNNNINAFGTVCFSDTPYFTISMKKYCGKVMTITEIINATYRMKEDNSMFCWTDKMIECLVEEETKPKFKVGDKEYYSTTNYLVRPSGYQFVDENDNVINTNKIFLRKKIIPNLKLDSIRTVREYYTEHSRIWLEIYEDEPNICVITHLLVDEDHRQEGYGTKALEQAEIIAKDLGCDTINLKVEDCSWIYKWYLRSGYMFLTNAEDNYVWLTKSI